MGWNQILAMKKAAQQSEKVERTDCPTCGWPLEGTGRGKHCGFCGWIDRLAIK